MDVILLFYFKWLNQMALSDLSSFPSVCFIKLKKKFQIYSDAEQPDLL